MGRNITKSNQDFEHIHKLITEARSRVYSKANSELVLLYFNVGKVVSEKVNVGNWGENTVQELADFIQTKIPNLSGFNRRGLYRIKQFFEVYTAESEVFQLWLKTQEVSPTVTQFQSDSSQYDRFVTTVLTQIQWSSHLHIINKTKTAEEKIFYLLKAISQRLSVRELERQLNTATFERTMLSNKSMLTTQVQLPDNFFLRPLYF